MNIIPPTAPQINQIITQPETKKRIISLKEIIIIFLSINISTYIGSYSVFSGFFFKPGPVLNGIYAGSVIAFICVLLLAARLRFSFQKLKLYYLTAITSLIISCIPFVTDVTTPMILNSTNYTLYSIYDFLVLEQLYSLILPYSITHTYFTMWTFHFLYWAVLPLPFVWILKMLFRLKHN